MIDQAAALAGIVIADEYKAAMLDGLNQQRSGYEAIRKLHLPNSVAPAFVFDPLPPGATLNTQREKPIYSKAPASLTAPANLEDLAFASAMTLADLIRRRKISSVALTDMYLARLKRYDPVLHFGITLTEDRAHNQAREADADIARGNYRGPLHGLPWGAKDLLAVKGYPTTWGAGGFEHQVIDQDATVVQRLDAAGAVLIAKLTLGALAMGDKWYGGRTRNPWNLETRLQRLFRRARVRNLRRLRRLLHRLGNPRLHLLTLHALRRHWPPPHFWICSPHRRHGSQLDHG